MYIKELFFGLCISLASVSNAMATTNDELLKEAKPGAPVYQVNVPSVNVRSYAGTLGMPAGVASRGTYFLETGNHSSSSWVYGYTIDLKGYYVFGFVERRYLTPFSRTGLDPVGTPNRPSAVRSL